MFGVMGPHLYSSNPNITCHIHHLFTPTPDPLNFTSGQQKEGILETGFMTKDKSIFCNWEDLDNAGECNKTDYWMLITWSVPPNISRNKNSVLLCFLFLL